MPEVRKAGSLETTVLFTALVAATYGFGVYLFATLLAEMRQTLALDYAAVGYITAAVQLGFLAGALGAGFAAPRLGLARLVLASVALCAACLLVLPWARSALTLGALLTLMGLTSATVWVPMVALARERIAPAHVGKALGLMSSGTAYGVFLNGWLVPALVPRWGWPSVWWAVGGLTVLLLLWALWRLGGQAPPGVGATQPAPLSVLQDTSRTLCTARTSRTSHISHTSHTSRRPGDWRSLLLRPASLAVMALMFLSGVACMPAQNYLMPLLREQLHYGLGDAARAWTLIGAVGMVGGLALGALADRITARRALWVAYALLGTALACYWWHSNITMVYVGSMLFGFAFNGIFGLVPAYVGARYGAAEATVLFGISNVMLGLGAMLGNVVGGLSRNALGDFDAVFALCLLAAGAALFISLWLPAERPLARIYKKNRPLAL